MNRLKELRERRGITQTQLGQILDVEKSTISKYEKGTLGLSSNAISTLCDYFGVSADYLLGLSETPTTAQERYDMPAEDIEAIIEEMHKNPRIKTLFYEGSRLSKSDLEKILRIIEVMHDEEKS